MTRRTSRWLALALALWLPFFQGCLIGSPVAAFTGHPYGMTIDDVEALSGEEDAFWSHSPVFAAIDLPFAAILDTALFPIAGLIWLVKEALGLDGEGDEEDRDVDIEDDETVEIEDDEVEIED